jgi:hypothetical protein
MKDKTTKQNRVPRSNAAAQWISLDALPNPLGDMFKWSGTHLVLRKDRFRMIFPVEQLAEAVLLFKPQCRRCPLAIYNPLLS